MRQYMAWICLPKHVHTLAIYLMNKQGISLWYVKSRTANWHIWQQTRKNGHICRWAFTLLKCVYYHTVSATMLSEVIWLIEAQWHIYDSKLGRHRVR